MPPGYPLARDVGLDVVYGTRLVDRYTLVPSSYKPTVSNNNRRPLAAPARGYAGQAGSCPSQSELELEAEHAAASQS
jgi:hypothetical protein